MNHDVNKSELLPLASTSLHVGALGDSRMSVLDCPVLEGRWEMDILGQIFDGVVDGLMADFVGRESGVDGEGGAWVW